MKTKERNRHLHLRYQIPNEPGEDVCSWNQYLAVGLDLDFPEMMASVAHEEEESCRDNTDRDARESYADGYLVQAVYNRLVSESWNLLAAQLPGQPDSTASRPAQMLSPKPAFSSQDLPWELFKWLQTAKAVATSTISIRDQRVSAAVDQLLSNRERRSTSGAFSLLPNDGIVLAIMLVLSQFWLRPLENWSVPPGERNDRLRSLLNHLFVKYPVPEFLYPNWYSGTLGAMEPDRHTVAAAPEMKWVYWFILMGQGASLVRAARLFDWLVPSKLTSYLYQAPPALEPLAACMWAEIMRRGGSQTDFDRLIQNRAFLIDPTEPQSQESFVRFWHETVHWLVRYHDAITDQDCLALLDWALHEFIESQRHAGRTFSWKGRSPARAREAALEYRQSMNVPYARLQWSTRYETWECQCPAGPKWSVVELTSGKELFAEGRTLKHCVSTYAPRCTAGDSAILSFRQDGKRTLTVEVDPHSNRVVQMRGRRNRAPTGEEEDVVQQWRQR